MEFKLNEYHAQLTDEEILEDIKRVAKQLSTNYISRTTYEKYGKYSSTAVRRHFETWKNALSKAGLTNEYEVDKRIKDEELLEDIKHVANSMNCVSLSALNYKQLGKYSVNTIIDRFGSWNKALENSGLYINSNHKIEKQELFEEIERIWMQLGRQPTSTDIRNGQSKYSLNTFLRSFGGWRNALKEFVVYINENEEHTSVDNEMNSFILETVENPVNVKKEIPIVTEVVHKTVDTHKTKRDINLRLRFKVMQRDNFKCCMCGASPATDPNVILHIDHIKPWSKGGETVIENLQTLCSKCNLGKSDLEL